jgi:hypothetical protein
MDCRRRAAAVERDFSVVANESSPFGPMTERRGKVPSRRVYTRCEGDENSPFQFLNLPWTREVYAGIG